MKGDLTPQTVGIISNRVGVYNSIQSAHVPDSYSDNLLHSH
jgi:hypothetical protein